MCADFPYDQYRHSEAWRFVGKAIDDLEDNGDIILQTHRDYVVGYLVALLCKAGMADPEQSQ